MACADRNGLTDGLVYRHVNSYESGTYPNAMLYHYSLTCNHCAMPACMANCPAGAIVKDPDDGTVTVSLEDCIGCGTCTTNCPYHIPVVLDAEGKVGKCDGCKPFRDAGLNPCCVDACVMRALDYGDIEELRAKYGSECVSELPFLPAASETTPSVLITPKEAALSEEYREFIV